MAHPLRSTPDIKPEPAEDEQQQQFDFITVENPAHAAAASTRSRVRAHVAREQHRKARVARHHAGQSTLRDPAIGPGSNIKIENPRPGRLYEMPRNPTPFSDPREVEAPHRQALIPRALTLARSASFVNSMAYESLLDDPAGHVSGALRGVQLDFPTVMAHYAWIVSTQARDFERQFAPAGTTSPFNGAQLLLSHIFKDPALIASAALLATSHVLAIRYEPMSPAIARCIYELRGFIMSSINAAFNDPNRALSGPLIMAVLLFATHEGLQGSRDHYHTHMSGLIHMINLRGGLASLASYHVFLERFIVWQDANVAAIMGVQPYCTRAKQQSTAQFVKPNSPLWLLTDDTG